MPDDFNKNDVDPDELISRLEWRHNKRRNSWVRQNGSIRPRAFSPRRDLDRVELSMVRFVGLDLPRKIQLGNQFAEHASKRLGGHIFVPATVLLEKELKFDPDNLPFERHLNIFGWSDDADDMEKEIAIAEKAKYEDLQGESG